MRRRVHCDTVFSGGTQDRQRSRLKTASRTGTIHQETTARGPCRFFLSFLRSSTNPPPPPPNLVLPQKITSNHSLSGTAHAGPGVVRSRRLTRGRDGGWGPLRPSDQASPGGRHGHVCPPPPRHRGRFMAMGRHKIHRQRKREYKTSDYGHERLKKSAAEARRRISNACGGPGTGHKQAGHASTARAGGLQRGIWGGGGGALCAVRKVGYFGPEFPDGQGHRGNHRVPGRRTAPDSYPPPLV